MDNRLGLTLKEGREFSKIEKSNLENVWACDNNNRVRKLHIMYWSPVIASVITAWRTGWV